MSTATKAKITALNASASSIGTLLILVTVFFVMLFMGSPTDDYRYAIRLSALQLRLLMWHCCIMRSS